MLSAAYGVMAMLPVVFAVASSGVVVAMSTSDYGPFNQTRTKSTKLRTDLQRRYHAV
jgi:hypothetical protein